jgi:hypothetical protein
VGFQEGQGRQDRKLAVARRRRRRGRSEFVVAQTQDGVFCAADKSFLGTVAANLVGSKYQIWGQVPIQTTTLASFTGSLPLLLSILEIGYPDRFRSRRFMAVAGCRGTEWMS